MTNHDPTFNFDNTYARELEGFYVPWQGATAPAPKIVLFNRKLADDLGLNSDALNSADGAAIFAGSMAPEGATPLAQAYAGHQFGGFSEQLGDGRALLLGEVLDNHGTRFDLQLKGSGRTPFSRGGDGKAVLGPVLREYLMGEAMHALGVPTTRALAAVTTGEEVARDGMKPGAVLARIASSHLRVGTLQFFAARKEWDKVRKLADYAIDRHYPELASADDKYLGFLSAVLDQQASLVAKWLHAGFVHGVMNTDNMTISGETIDYGPCAFVDAYDPKAVFSSIDRDGRYAFGNQPVITQWNLTRFAETLLPLIDPDDSDSAIRLATNVINSFVGRYTDIWTIGMRTKIGLASSEDDDAALINDLFTAMEGQNVDYTLFFRSLADAALGQDGKLVSLFDDGEKILAWLKLWHERLLRDPLDPNERAKAMNSVNPIYIPRNHRVEEALVGAEAGDMAPYAKLLDVLADPFTKRDGLETYEGPAPDGFGPYKTFCGT
ncbi:protein adenylyltransferase SelO [Litoreibacter halocynthiae]|uniref:protein adenylyltransferase SelO n=1 Tax=Litoreibacter halocynthiae TaxID=1242689 RepID=UPI0024902B28|nr:YdiU family protein [Litoreibacter halocynthiae]